MKTAHSRCEQMLSAIVKRFPEHEFTARRLFQHDAAFREICDDLRAAMQARAYWEGDKIRAVEYQEIVTDLEDEIAKILERQAAGSTAGLESRCKM